MHLARPCSKPTLNTCLLSTADRTTKASTLKHAAPNMHTWQTVHACGCCWSNHPPDASWRWLTASSYKDRSNQTKNLTRQKALPSCARYAQPKRLSSYTLPHQTGPQATTITPLAMQPSMASAGQIPQRLCRSPFLLLSSTAYNDCRADSHIAISHTSSAKHYCWYAATKCAAVATANRCSRC